MFFYVECCFLLLGLVLRPLPNEPTNNFKTSDTSDVENMNELFIKVTMRENNDETIKDICQKISKTAFEFVWNGGRISALTIWLGVKITLLVAGIICKAIEQQK